MPSVPLAAGLLLPVRRGGEQVQGQVRGLPPDVGGVGLDQGAGPLRMVPVVLQVLPGEEITGPDIGDFFAF